MGYRMGEHKLVQAIRVQAAGPSTLSALCCSQQPCLGYRALNADMTLRKATSNRRYSGAALKPGPGDSRSCGSHHGAEHRPVMGHTSRCRAAIWDWWLALLSSET